uniref:FSA_C domain-containing protein n=1 Tax=Rhabditophanes sp. KR3021 TaxID=114890 RepID=A0AC35TQR5_9BILA
MADSTNYGKIVDISNTSFMDSIGAVTSENKTDVILSYKNVGIGFTNGERVVVFTAQLLIAVWFIFLIFFFSRIVALIVKALIKWYLKFCGYGNVHFDLGSFEINIIAGKIMFRNVVMVNNDMSLKINDGWIVFSYWKKSPKPQDLIYHMNDSRLKFSFNGLTLHVHNRLDLYKDMAKGTNFAHLFDHLCNEGPKVVNRKGDEIKLMMKSDSWYDSLWALSGAIRIDIYAGKIILGNHCLPSAFVTSFENMKLKMHLSNSTNQYDRNLLKVKASMESVKMLFVKSTDCELGLLFNPPRTMGHGYAVLHSAQMDLFYSQELLGIQSDLPQSANDHVPTWDSLLRFGSNTVISWGPWADKQKNLIYNFFFPSPYGIVTVTSMPKPGQRRTYINHNMKMSFFADANFDIWFLKNDELQSLQSNFKKGTIIDMSFPWITMEDGYKTYVKGTLMNLEIVTSLPFKKFIKCQSLSINLLIDFPKNSTAHQSWNLNLDFDKAAITFIWDHKRLLSDLITEWTAETVPDLKNFVPYTWNMNIIFSNTFEIDMLLNDKNWVDTTTFGSAQNFIAAVCGNYLSVKFPLSFIDFSPKTIETNYEVVATDNISLKLKLPDNSTTHSLFYNLMQNANVHVKGKKQPFEVGEWIEIWKTHKIACLFNYIYHPCIINFESDIPREITNFFRPKMALHPSQLKPDSLKVKIDVADSDAIICGILIRGIFDMKNNYFGLYDQTADIFSDLPSEKTLIPHGRTNENDQVDYFRAIDVNLEIRVKNINGHIVTYCARGKNQEYLETCPMLFTEQVVIELVKTNQECQVQVFVPPACIYFFPNQGCSAKKQGFLSLSGLQFRGQGLFSEIDIPWELACVEYAWSMELTLGNLIGSIQMPHVVMIKNILETLLLHFLNKDDVLLLPNIYDYCQHYQDAKCCTNNCEKDLGIPCYSSEQLKFEQFKLSVDSVDIKISEVDYMLNLKTDSVRFAICNSHFDTFCPQITAIVPEISLSQLQLDRETDNWLETTEFSIKNTDLCVKLPVSFISPKFIDQRILFLRKYDNLTKRLRFLYSNEESCGCMGDSFFFAKDDITGKAFFKDINKKFAEYSVNVNENEQPFFGQSILKSKSGILFLEELLFNLNESVSESFTRSNSDLSFRSASSNPNLCDTSNHYNGFLDCYEYNADEIHCPEFVEPGCIEKWINYHIPHTTKMCTGIKAIQLIKKEQKLKKEVSKGLQTDSKIPNALYVEGKIAESITLFMTPLTFKGLEKFCEQLTEVLTNIQPMLFVQGMYDKCSSKCHQQPLTANLLKNKEFTRVFPSVFMNVKVPSIELKYFHSESNLNASHLTETKDINASFLLFKIEKTTLKGTTNKGNELLKGEREMIVSVKWDSINCSIFYVLDEDGRDIVYERIFPNYTTNWNQISSSELAPNKCLRVISEIGIKELKIKANMYSCFSSNKDPYRKKNDISIQIGSIFNTSVFGTLLEMGYSKEQSFYDILWPMLSEFTKLGGKFLSSVHNLIARHDHWSDICVLKCMADTLDCTNEKVFEFERGTLKDIMVNSKMLNSCGTCCLMLMMLNNFSFESEFYRKNYFNDISDNNDQFLMKENRKNAMIALLSHWQTIVCSRVTLADNHTANKYKKVPDADPNLELQKLNHESNKKVKPEIESEAKSTSVAIDIDTPVGTPSKRIYKKNEDLLSKKDSNLDQLIHRGPRPSFEQNQSIKRPGHSRNGSAVNGKEIKKEEMDLYHFVKQTANEMKERFNEKFSPSTSSDTDVNGMEILLDIFFWPVYRQMELDNSVEYSLPSSMLRANFSILLSDIVFDVVERKAKKCQNDEVYSVIIPHRILQVNSFDAQGSLAINAVKEYRQVKPAKIDIKMEYEASIERIKLGADIASVGFTNEILSLVFSLLEVTEGPIDVRRSIISFARFSDHKLNNWTTSVLDKLNDYQRNLNRKKVEHVKRTIRMDVRGIGKLKTILLESMFSDLFLSIPFQEITLTHTHMQNDNAVAELKEVIRSDSVHLIVTKGNLVLTERSKNDGLNNAKDILICSVKKSTFSFKRSINSIDAFTERNVIKIKLGDVNGEIPMHAQSVHEMVLKHGPQFTEQLNKLGIHQIKPASNFSPIPTTDSADSSLRNNFEHSYLGPKTSFGLEDIKKVTMKRELNTQLTKKRTWTFIVDFDIQLSTILLNAKLLPSLSTQYKLDKATANGTIGKSVVFNVKIYEHGMLFQLMNGNSDTTKALIDTFTLPLPYITINGTQNICSANDVMSNGTSINAQLTLKEGNYFDISIEVGAIEHSFSTDLLNQILFAEQRFRTELTHVLKRISKMRMTMPDEVAGNHNLNATNEKPMLFNINVKGEGVPWLQLTASTPTYTAIRFTLDSPTLTLTNRYKMTSNNDKDMLNPWIGRAKVQMNVKLGQLYKDAMFKEIKSELQELATFMTQISAQNEEISPNTPNNYVFSLNRPILYIKSTAIDKAVLLWLNYKNTYDYWREERAKFINPVYDDDEEHEDKATEEPSSDMNLNLSLSIQNGLYVCMPLYSADFNDNLSALLISLQKTEITVCIKKELACAANFNSFKISFIENFDEHSLSDEWLEKNTGDSNHSNFIYFPHGSYKLFSSVSRPISDAVPKWLLSIKSQMKGMTIDVNDKIGKFLSLFIQTFSNFGNAEEYDFYNESSAMNNEDNSSEDIDDSDEEFHSINEGEDRTRWLERKMHEKSLIVTDLIQYNLDERQIEEERRKLHKLELAKFKQFRKSVFERIKRGARGQKNENIHGKKRISFNLGESEDLLSVPKNLNSLISPPNPFKKGSLDEEISSEDFEKIDMLIDVQLNIESGQCILRCNPTKVINHNLSGQFQRFPIKQPKDMKQRVVNEDKYTVKLAIPSVGVKVFYTSNDPMTSKPEHISTIFEEQIKTRSSSKNGCFYLAIELASMPQETLVTPLLADYFEQVVEPLPQHFFEPSNPSTHGDVLSDGMPIVAIDTSGLPLDVLFHLNVQASTMRFEGQQQKSHAADCLLTLPRLTLLASTRKYNESDKTVAGIHISAMLSNFSLSVYSPHQLSNSHDALSLSLDKLSVCVSRTKNPPTAEEPNRIQLVITTNIGVAYFNYDLRRLSELLAFPKPWYRKVLVKRIFLGEYAVNQGHGRRFSNSTIQMSNSDRVSNVLPPKNALTASQGDIKSKYAASAVFSLQWKELKVKAQMANTMGNTEWNAVKGSLRGNFDINSSGHRNLSTIFKVDSSLLAANGGAISGTIAINNLFIAGQHIKDENKAPKNSFKLALGCLESRMEWMSNTIFIGRFTEPTIEIEDDWQTKTDKEDVSESCCLVKLSGAWQDLQMIITKNTISDFMKMTTKLHFFFNEQLNNSRLVWGSEYDLTKKSEDNDSDDVSFSDSCSLSKHSSETSFDYANNRYWHKIMDFLTLLQLERPELCLFPSNSTDGTIIRGCIELDARKVSVACMHGDINANEWALFHLSEMEAFISSTVKFCFMNKETRETGLDIEQKFKLKLGKDEIHNNKAKLTECKALVCKVIQSRNFLITNNASIDFCLSSIIDDSLKNTSVHQIDKVPGKHNHTVLELFILPALVSVLNTLQRQHSDKALDVNHDVECTFIAEFHDYISLLPDPYAQIGFLPKLIQVYKNAIVTDAATSKSPPTEEGEQEKSKDKRVFKCNTWTAAPNLQFLHSNRQKWSVPVLDEILNVLHIYDHRRTIPKVLQRGVLDNADAIIALIIKEMLVLTKKD